MILLWLLLFVAAVTLVFFASRSAIDAAVELADRLGISTFVIGLTVVAIGTDLPEIANSIAASVSGHGDLNVGDSVGSAATQITLVLGLLPLAAGPFAIDRRRLVPIGALTAVALAIGLLLVQDGRLSRFDGFLLCAAWAGSAWWVWRRPAAAA